MEKPITKEKILQQADSLRDLARRSRRVADTLTLESDRRRVQRHAVELEETADGLEKQAAGARTGVFAPVVARRAGDAG